jgi:hypothetical protein
MGSHPEERRLISLTLSRKGNVNSSSVTSSKRRPFDRFISVVAVAQGAFAEIVTAAEKNN